jgi:hypothetical protein
MSARAAQPGATEERLGAEYDARAGLSFSNARIHADRVYGRDHIEVNAGPERELVPKYPIPLWRKEEAENAFVITDGHRQLLREVSGRHVVLIRGARGTGKYALATKLVMEARPSAVYCFGPATDVSALRGEDFGKGAGYLLEDLADTAAPALTAFEAQRLEQELDRLGSLLVITIPVGTVMADQALAKLISEMREPAEPADVAQRHLLWRAGPDDRARAERLLARADVAELIKKECGAGGDLGRAAQIAHMIAQASEADGEVVTKVAERLAMGEIAAFEHWFEGITDLETQCLAIAIAVFGGEPYDTVASLARRLQERLQLPESVDKPERPRSAPISATRRRRLEQLRATLRPATVVTRHGGAPPGLIVRFRDETTPVNVLDYVWDELDEIRSELTGWLRGCARHELATIRVRAAVAVGILTARSFDAMRASVILPWVAARDADLRDAAAVALNNAAQDEPKLAPAVRNMVLAWSAEDEKPSVRAGAVRAWRALLDDDGSAVGLLDSLAATSNADIIEAICLSVAEYLALDEDHRQREAIGLLHDWARARDPDRRLVGELAFVYAAADLVEKRPGGTRHQEEVWPALLAIADRDPMRQEELATLWQGALCSPDVYEAAHLVLAQWAHTVEPVPAARRALGRLLALAARSDRCARIIRHQAARWTRAETAAAAPETSRVVKAYLEGRN